MNHKQICILLLGILIIVINIITFEIPYGIALHNGLNWNKSCDDVTVSESLLLLSGDAGFATAMAIISGLLGYILIFNQFSNYGSIKYIISFLYLAGLVFFSTLPFVVANPIIIPKTDPLPNLPNGQINQVYNPIAHKILAFLFGLCLTICFIISALLIKKLSILLYILIIVCLLLSFLGSVIYMSIHEKDIDCTQKDIGNKWFSINEFIFLIMINIWILIISTSIY